MTAVLEIPSIDVVPVEEVVSTTSPEQRTEKGLRETTPRDYLRAAGWGITSGIAAAAVSVAVLPVQNLAIAFVLGAGLGVLGYLDHVTQLIRNWHTAVFATAATVLIVATQVSQGGVLLPAVLSAAAAFVFLVVLALFLPGRFVGGGDIKLAPVPAALLAALSPFAALLWLQFMFVCALVGMVGGRLIGKREKHMAMAPYMAVAVVPALGVYGVMAPALGF